MKITRVLLVLFVFAATCLFCNWPHFHPESHLGLSYHWALDILFHSSYFFVATVGLLYLVSKNINPLYICASLWLLGFVLEIIQLWVPGRTFTLLDLFSNTLGIVVGLFVFQFFNVVVLKSR